MRSPTTISIPTFWRLFSLRHARTEWMQTVLLLLILGLGVGTFLSIRMANRAAVEGFQLFTESLKGPSDWIIEAPTNGIPVEALPRIREQLGSLPVQIFPVVERNLTRVLPSTGDPGGAGSTIRLLGVDLVQIRSVASSVDNGSMDDFWSIIDDPDHLLVSREVADRWQVSTGDPVSLVLNGRKVSFTIRGILPEFRDSVPLPANLAIADLGALLQRLDRATLERIEVIVPEGAGREATVERVGSLLQEAFGSRWSVTSPTDKEVDGAAMTAAFRLNLTVLSLIALLVGLYLIAQTLDATVSRRRTEIASLRSLGLAPRDIQRLWLSEALLYGVAAGIVGLLMGYAMATITVEAVTTTVRALYRDTAQTAATLRFSDGLLAFALGIGGSLVAAWLPARDAASTPPAQFLRLGKRIPPFPVFQHPWIGLAAIALGALLLFLPPWQPRPGTTVPVMGYATAFLWLTGGTLATVGSLRWLGRILHRTAPDSAPARLAASRLRQPTSRHQLALSGFFVAIGMAASMAFLINSFQHTVTAWLEQRLQADLFLSSAGFQGADSGQRMPGIVLDRIEKDPEILELDRYRSVEVRVNGSRTTLGGSRFDLLGDRQRLLWINGPLDPDSRPPDTDAIAYANENLIRRTGLAVGEAVRLTTPSGPVVLWIGGVHADYARDNGSLLVDLGNLESWYQFSEYDTAGAFLSETADPAIVQARLREAHPGLAVRQNGELMDAALFIFNQTFAVTRALQLIGLVVALAGLALSLLSLLRESGRELSLQRTLGMSRREIALTTALEGMGIALAGLLSGILLSIGLGLVLIYVINRQSFGWTLQLAFPWTDILLLASGVLGLGLLIAYATGWLYLRKWKAAPL